MKVKLALAAAAAAAAAAGSLAAAPAASASSPHPLIIVYMENQSLNDITSTYKAYAPYLNSLWASASVEQFTKFYGVKHSSFNDYAALASGYAVAGGATSAGEYEYYTPPGGTRVKLTTVWNQLFTNGTSWGVYEESMPSACYAGGSTGEYKIGHNPAMPFYSIYPGKESPQCEDVVPLGSSTVPTAAVSFVTPNLCDDMHGGTGCATGTALIKAGDTWLSDRVPTWAESADVLIMFDESSTGDNSGSNGDTGGHIYAVLTGPGVPGGNNSTYYDAYSVLAGIEDAYHLTLLGNAADSTTHPITLP